MIFAQILFITLLLSLWTHSFNFWALSSIPHFACQKLLAPSELGRAFLCGVNLSSNNQDFKIALTRLGLVHLIVVSGSHLFYLRQGLRFFVPFLKKFLGLELFVCFFYGAICWWDPPVTRACIQLLVHYFSRKEKLNLSLNQEILWAGLLSLLIFPHWLVSLSFCLSWLASLGLCIGKKSWHQATLCFFILTPALLPLGGIHPLTILANLILGPILGLSLLPISIGYVLNIQDFIFLDEIELFIKKLFIAWGQLVPKIEKATDYKNLNYQYLWLYIAGITAITVPSRLPNNSPLKKVRNKIF